MNNEWPWLEVLLFYSCLSSGVLPEIAGNEIAVFENVPLVYFFKTCGKFISH
jgi:hypothetical protein